MHIKHVSSFFLPKDSHLPSSIHQNSPLKRKRTDLDRLTTNVVLRRSLFVPTEKKQKIEIETVVPLLEQGVIEKEPISIRLQWDTFQKTLQQSEITPQELTHILTIIKTILQEPGFNEKDKLIELGILHYYFASQKEIPTLKKNETLLEHRILAIDKEADGLERKHEKHSTKASELKLPSGCTTYLMRAVTRMIFPPDGAFNLGGCYAVMALLESHVNAFLTDEMRAQILNITQRFINDEAFRMLFQEPFEVHSQMEELIRLDLKLPLQEKISFIYVRWCLVTALLTSIGQSSGKCSESNCYAVSITINLLNNAPEVVVQLMIEALRKGSFRFDGIEIPISLLMESRARSEPDFKVDITANRARDSVPYLTTSDALGIPLSPKLRVDEQYSLGAWIEKDFSLNVKLAKDFFISHRVSFLQQMILSTLQFCSQNSTNVQEAKSTKVEFLQTIMKSIEEDMAKLVNTPMVEETSFFEELWDSSPLGDFEELWDSSFNKNSETYLSLPQPVLNGKDSGLAPIQENPLWQVWFLEFVSSVTSSIFCLDYTHWDLQVVDNKVVFDNHAQGFIFNGNLNDYKPFQKTRRLFHFSSVEGTFKPVDRLSAFSDLCVEHLDKQASSPHAATNHWHNILHGYLKSPEFLNMFAHFLQSFNKEDSALSWEEYFKADSLFLIQDGGLVNHTTDLPIVREKFQDTMSMSNESVGNCFVNLCQWVTSNRQQLGSYVLSRNLLHVFNIVPDLFQRYLENPFEAVQKNVIVPGVQLLHKQLSFKEMERVLKIKLGAEPGVAFAKQHFELLTMSCLQFARRVEILLKLEPEKDLTFNYALNHVTQSFNFKNFNKKLAPILTELNLSLDNQTYSELVYEMEVKKERSIFTPIQGAYLLQSALTAMLPSIFVSKFKLEEAIRTCFNFPQVVWIANLNWINGKAEKPSFDYLTLRYDIGERRVVFGSRKGIKDQPFTIEESDVLCKKMMLYF